MLASQNRLAVLALKRLGPVGKGSRNRNWFQEKGSQFGGSHSLQGARRSAKTNWKRIFNIRAAKRFN